MFDLFGLIYFLDLIGVFACSAAASLLAKRKGMDFSGAIIVAIVGAIGGGTTRDLLLDRHPLFWLKDLNYLLVITTTALLVQIFYYKMRKLRRSIRWFDAVGLAAFSVIGFEAAMSYQMMLPIVVLMGTITAVVGGMGRDIICRQIPYVMRKEIYIFAAVFGGVIYIVLYKLDVPRAFNQLFTLTAIITVRMLAVYRGWNLPNITLRF